MDNPPMPLTTMRKATSSRFASGAAALGIFLAALLGGCQKHIEVPPITAQPTGVYHPGMIVWADLVTPDVQKAKTFYGHLFGWEFQGEEGKDAPFTLITQGGVPIGGIVYSGKMDPTRTEARWLSYISVGDVDAGAEAARLAGGKVFVEPFDLPQRGRLAVILDPQGVPVGLLKASHGDPPYERVTPFRWMWHELWTSDTASAASFYAKIVGYTKATASLSLQQGSYTVFMSDGRAQAGMGQLPRKDMEALWLPYINVEDPQGIAAKVLTLGGAVVIAPDSARRQGTVAIIADPTGAMLAIQKWTAQDSLSK